MDEAVTLDLLREDDDEVLHGAACSGRRTIFVWLLFHDFVLDGATIQQCSEHMDIVRFLVAREHFGEYQWCMAGLAACGDLETLKRIHRPFLNFPFVYMVYAAENGHLETLQWIFSHAADLNEGIVYVAARRGHLHVLEWVHAVRPSFLASTLREASVRAAEGGHIPILRWFKGLNCHWTVETACGAARFGTLDTLMWLHDEGCPMDVSVCSSAAMGGNLSILAWLRGKGCEMNANTMRCAVQLGCPGGLALVRWVVEHGCPIDAMALLHAAGSGRTDVVEYLLGRWSHTHDVRARALEVALDHGFLDIVHML